jgi:hypothetical protein
VGRLLDGADVGWLGWVGCVGGALVVVLLVGGADDGTRVWWVTGVHGGGVVGAWPGSGALPVTFAGGGNCWIGSPTRSAFITAAQVAVG